MWTLKGITALPKIQAKSNDPGNQRFAQNQQKYISNSISGPSKTVKIIKVLNRRETYLL